MRKIGIIAVLSMLLVAFTASAALARPTPTSGAHFTQGGTPTCTIDSNGASSAEANCFAELAGLGEGNIQTAITLEGQAVYQCQNQGGNIAPGQNKVLVGPTTTPGEVTVPEGTNGRVAIPAGPATLTASDTATAKQAGCPNKTWTGVNPQLSVTSITYSASQGGVTLFSCTREGTNLSGTINFTDAECSGVARF
jgi:hypothetical protein